jgi:putative transcriptional regulator
LQRSWIITVQGASEYLRRMKKEGTIQSIGGELRATKKGIEFLHSNFSELKDFVDTKISELNIIDVCAALAKTPIKKGDSVGLFMENGVLTAYSNRESKSNGTAISNADIDEDVAIKDLDGMVSLSPGILQIVKLPSIREGGSGSISKEKIKSLYDSLEPDRVGIMDVVSLAVVKKAGIESDFEFATLNAAVEAVEKGLSVMVFASGDQVNNIVSSIEEINTAVEDKIAYQIIYSKK